MLLLPSPPFVRFWRSVKFLRYYFYLRSIQSYLLAMSAATALLRSLGRRDVASSAVSAIRSLTGNSKPAYVGSSLSGSLYYSTSYGQVCRVADSFVDVKFKDDLPPLLAALKVCGHSTQLEVAKHLTDGVVRTLALSTTKGILIGSLVCNTCCSIMVPVGEGTLGRIMNVVGKPIDDMGDIERSHCMPIHKKIEYFLDQAKVGKILCTGIKVIDLLTPIPKGGSIGLIGAANEQKTLLMMELINNISGSSVYAGVGEQTKLKNLSTQMIQTEHIKKCALVYGQLNEPVGVRMRGVFAGLTMAEYFRDVKGEDTLLFIDDLFQLLQASQEIKHSLGLFPCADKEDMIPSHVTYQESVSSNLAFLQGRSCVGQNGGSITSIIFADPRADGNSVHFDVTLSLSQEEENPIIDPFKSESVMVSPYYVGKRHYNIARKVLILLESYKNVLNIISELGTNWLIEKDKETVSRARKVLLLLGQPLGKHVSLDENLDSFEGVVEGEHDDLPEEAFYMVGGIQEAKEKAARLD